MRADLERLKVVGTVEDAERKAAEWGRRAQSAADELDRLERAAEPSSAAAARFSRRSGELAR